MGFSPKLLVADLSLILSIAIAFYAQTNHVQDNVKIGLIILATIFLTISIVINIVSAVQKRRERRK
ncbi:hypothetical protein FEZ41_10305 [Lentilactobacillus parafarraginis]|jgi:hypothetical protein|uniref:Uncharacterized protein n=3 Tax=Lentilactobacillus parafarraginis TaxID=390842 RepID=A0A0R1YRH1_9LACO|nr:hypothetical protein [Lentilactobacillus parafarraginis]EHL99118.1 hypothetical protein HMPREF9103_01123 [Lentilactobacillus parafarraginis F0439]KRM41859.1 hypothetical protein FD47_GL002050 [Lentilactobacillus parafarraginis DSM 18390 = JCM 14109]TLQ17975.1 hypothetical protein FEZ41_10305 [Lentilactobacillus parafarraginis]